MAIQYSLKRLFIKLLKNLEIGSAASLKLVKLTGKSTSSVHPKHLIDFSQLYYIPFLEKNDQILDLGCHSGTHLFKISSFIDKGIGLDIDTKLLDQAKKTALEKSIRNLSFKKADLESKLSFPKNSFDKVLFFAVLEHLKSRDQILSEIKRVLKPKGTVFLSVPNKNTNWKHVQKTVDLNAFSDQDHKIEFSKNSIISLLKKHNFKQITVQSTAFDTPFSGVIDFMGGLSLSTYKKLMKWKINKGKSYPQQTVGWLVRAHV